MSSSDVLEFEEKEDVAIIDRYINKGQILDAIKSYPRTKEAELFRRIIVKTAGSKNSIEGYNEWATTILAQNVIAQGFTSDDGVQISFKDVKLEKPFYVVKGRKEVLYPEYCRKYKYPYTGKLTAICVARKDDQIKETEVHIGDIPIMLGSIKCNLHGKTPEELVALGECISDPFGYFVISTERSVITNDKLRCNLPLLYRSKKNDPTPIVSETFMTNKIMQLVLGKNMNSIEVQDRKFNVEKEPITLPIFIVSKVMAKMEPDEFISSYILRFVPSKFKERIFNALVESKFRYNNIQDPYLYVFNERPIYKEKKGVQLSKQDIYTMVENDMIDDIYIKYNNLGLSKSEKIDKKLLSFAYLISKMVMYLIGEHPLDSRDYWKVKRFESAPVLLSSLVDKIFFTAIKNSRKTKEGTNKSDYFTFAETLHSKSKETFTRFINNSFNTASWGVNTYGWTRENHAEATRRDTPLALWSQSVKNTNGSSTNGQVTEIRLLQPSQKNKHCSIETPEGKNVGIVKYNCLTGMFSIQRSDREILKFIEQEGAEYNEDEQDIIVFVNGIATKYVYEDFLTDIIAKKRRGEIPLDTEITFDRTFKIIQIFTDSSRPITPYLIVNPKSKNLVIDEIEGGWNMEYEELLLNGAMEILSAGEEDDIDIIICSSVEKFRSVREQLHAEPNEQLEKLHSYTHCCIDPLQCYSLSSSTCPMSNHQPPPRSTYQAAHGKQALGYYNINYHLKVAKEFKRLYKAERSLTETDTYFLPCMDIMPSGQIANVAIMCEADNQEDAIVLNEDYVRGGCLHNFKNRLIDDLVKNSSKDAVVQFKIPALKRNEDPKIYRHLNEDGTPKLDSYIKPGDCVIGKVLITPDGEKNDSIHAEVDSSGYVMSVSIVPEKGGRNPLIRVMLSDKRVYQAGDKMSIRYAQKGTVGRVGKREEFPIVKSGPNKGIRPDILFNPIGFPKRQTVGLLIEGILNKAAIYGCKRYDVSAFRDRLKDIEEAKAILEQYGLDSSCTEEMELNGWPLKNKVFLVPIYEQALKHHVKDKIQSRSIGPRDFKTRQPQGGRAKGSGLKNGEMEKDIYGAHGVANVIMERMMISSDEFKLVVCGNCGSIIDDKVCRVCDNSKPGILIIPYVFKVFVHLMMGMNMDIRLRTTMFK